MQKNTDWRTARKSSHEVNKRKNKTIGHQRGIMQVREQRDLRGNKNRIRFLDNVWVKLTAILSFIKTCFFIRLKFRKPIVKEA